MKIKIGEQGLKTLSLSFKEWQALLIDVIKNEKISYTNHKALIDKSISKVIEFFESKGCVEIEFITRAGEKIKARDYSDLEIYVEIELNCILDEIYKQIAILKEKINKSNINKETI